MSTAPGTNAQVRQVVEGRTLVVEIDNPPINAGSLAVRSGLLAAIRRLAQDPDLDAAVLIGAGRTFIAGSDLREFGQPLADPQLPQVIAAIEACPKPVVAALHGAALGGGFELALGCDARVAAAGIVVGLPEVTLGMVPGAGGTQRLPRLVGLPRAIAMICTGERVPAEAALALGLVDRCVEAGGVEALRAAAVALARAWPGGKRRVGERAVPACDAAALEASIALALQKGRNRPAVQEAIALTRLSAEVPLGEALARERAAFQSLRVSTEAFALRHQFFAEREAVKAPTDAPAREVRRVAVIGAGTMGTGIAIAMLEAGLAVSWLDQDAAALQRGHAQLLSHLKGPVNAGRLKASEAAAMEARLTQAAAWAEVADADLVVEAVFEDLGIKQAVFRQLDAVVRPGAVLATNTSYLDIDRIAAVTARPQDVLGLHFFSPANVMKLLEVVPGAAAAPDVVATGVALGRALGKVPVVAGNAFGFIGNRIYNAYRQQCEFMLEDGAWPEDVDGALVAMGMAMGPFAVADLSGLDIAWRMRQSQAATRDPRQRYVPVLDWLCEAGRLGRKAGAGYYAYPDGQRAAATDAFVRSLVEKASQARGCQRRRLEPAEIQRRALLAMVNEAAHLVREGVARRATDIDVVMVQGYGFPRWMGGPVFWARQQGADALADGIAALAHANGNGAGTADVSVLF